MDVPIRNGWFYKGWMVVQEVDSPISGSNVQGKMATPPNTPHLACTCRRPTNRHRRPPAAAWSVKVGIKSNSRRGLCVRAGP